MFEYNPVDKNNILVLNKTGTMGSNITFGYGLSGKDRVDLRNEFNTNKMIFDLNPSCVLLLASVVGGLKFHIEHKDVLLEDNLAIYTNVLKACKNNNVKRVVSFLSSCIFSDNGQQPYTEKQIHESAPSSFHEPYAMAKRILELQSRIYYEKFGIISNCIIPTNLYGAFDDFSLDQGHVIGSLIMKAYLAEKNNTEFVIWGDGSQERNFLFLEDANKLTEWAIEYYLQKEPLIFCNDQVVTIKKVAEIVARKFQIQDRLVFDTSKPVGQKKRLLSGERLKSLVDHDFVCIEVGVNKTIDWFLENYPNIRK